MSGGSHNYLYARAADDLGALADEVWAMAKALTDAGFPGVGDRTKRLADAIHAARFEARQLTELWHHMEWLRSGDWGRAPVRAEALKLGEQLEPCPHAVCHPARGYPGGEIEKQFGRVIGSFEDCDECGAALNFIPDRAP